MDTSSIDDYLKENLKPRRLKHTEGVVEMAVELAGIYGADPEKALIAAKCHDMCRNWGDERLNTFIELNQLGDEYIDEPNLSHSKAAALAAKLAFGIEDEDILNAISFHTTGRAGMSLLEKIIYISDAAEKGRDYPGVEKIRELAYKDLDEACLMSLRGTWEHVNKEGFTPSEDTALAIKWFEKELE